MKTSNWLLALLGVSGQALADPTWPSSVDEVEEIMYQLESFRARKFADTVNPCSNEASGPGRQNAAEWLRTAFHDMSTASVFFKTGGLDASLQYELTSSENKGPGLQTTLEFMAPYVSTRATLSDLIAAGVYASVRACGGPIVPIRGGRKDATVKGSTGVPQPQNSGGTFESQFSRMGFSVEEMIQVTACGHTIGGVHQAQFPDMVIPGELVNGENTMDKTTAVFDNKIVTEYLDGTTRNPLVIGPSVKVQKNSDFKVYNYDNNKTVTAMVDPTAFASACQRVLQKMVEVVPPGVTLTDPIQPYTVKPVELQLTLAQGGAALEFTGYIRVKTTTLKDVQSVTLTYKDRNGGSNCGSGGCVITLTVQGISQGFDDTFAFYPIDSMIPASSGISSFTITLNRSGGMKQNYDNNGNSYPLQDAIILQYPQSCLLGTSGALTVTAAVRNDKVANGATAVINYKTTRTTSPVPKLNVATINLTQGQCVGQYTFFSASYTIPGGLAYQSTIDVVSGDASDSFNAGTSFGGSCRTFSNPVTCGSGTSQSSSTSSSLSTGAAQSSAVVAQSSTAAAQSSTVVAQSSTVVAQSSTAIAQSSTVVAQSSTAVAQSSTVVAQSSTAAAQSTVVVQSSTTSTTSTAAPVATLSHRQAVGDWRLQSCWTDPNSSGRTLSGNAKADDNMTLEMCATFCKGYTYFGTEYGRECYCGNTLLDGTQAAPITDCNKPCAGDPTEYCGDGFRLELYKSTVVTPTSTKVAAAPTPSHVEGSGKYAFVGCWTEKAGGRALSQGAFRDDAMTNDLCASLCKGERYFATEYSSECYCGSHVDKDTQAAPLEDCAMTCSGDKLSYCGGPNRLELFMNPDIQGGDPQQPAAAGNFVWSGCYTDANTNGRALFSIATAADDMTNEKCADYCSAYQYFGTEYGRECYCGNTIKSDSTNIPDGQCNMLCAGSTVELCGAGSKMSIYVKKANDVLKVTGDLS